MKTRDELDSCIEQCRERVRTARRIVIKLGSRVLVQNAGRPQANRIRGLVREIAACRQEGREVIVVTSGAIGSGMEHLGMKRRPTSLPELQMAAAVGQCRLMALYGRLFSACRCKIGQVLLTHDDLKQRARHLNARNTMLAMLRAGIVPIVNENDVVAVDEIKFGDNDLLASLVVHLVQADLLILLTTADGLRKPAGAGRTRRVAFVGAVTDEVLGLAHGKGGELSTGGMASKLQSARAAAQAGGCVVIADGRRPGVVSGILAGRDVGTLIGPADDGSAMTGRKRWIAYFHRPQGALVVDEGARHAIAEKGKSLLPIGIKAVDGEFGVGAAVDIRGPDGAIVARGLSDYSSGDVRRIMGRHTADIKTILGAEACEEVVHRDNMAVAGGHNEPAR